MGKLIAIAAAGLLAAGGTYGLVSYTDICGTKAVDPADCPVVKVGSCPFCNGASIPSDATSSDGWEAACCADAGTIARATPADGHAAVAVAGPAGVFLTGKKTAKAACCCCEEEGSGGLAAVVGFAATVKK